MAVEAFQSNLYKSANPEAGFVLGDFKDRMDIKELGRIARRSLSNTASAVVSEAPMAIRAYAPFAPIFIIVVGTAFYIIPNPPGREIATPTLTPIPTETKTVTPVPTKTVRPSPIPTRTPLSETEAQATISAYKTRYPGPTPRKP